MDSELMPPADLERAVRAMGARLGSALSPVVEAAGGAEIGPQRLGDALRVDKVLASRLLRALRSADPVALLHRMPGPDPLRRALRGARRRLEVEPAVLDEASGAVDEFERFLAEEIGDRSALTSLLAAWSPEVRAEFELRRKQTAWRALSELRGSTVDLDVSAVLLHPAREPDRLDVVWVLGMIGVRRLRPGVPIFATTRRIAPEDAERRPRTLDGAPLESVDDGRLDRFCTSPPGRVAAHRAGDLLSYELVGDEYGPSSATDLLLAEVNEAEMSASVPRGSGRRGWVYADVTIPARRLVLDVLVHEDAYPAGHPELLLYDMAARGVADVNDPARDVDRLDLAESLCPLGALPAGAALDEFEPYTRLLEHVFERRSLDPARFRGYRVAVDYPLLGMQVAVAFDAPER